MTVPKCQPGNLYLTGHHSFWAGWGQNGVCLNNSSGDKQIGWMKRGEVGCPFEITCGPSAVPRPLGGKIMHTAGEARVPWWESGEVDIRRWLSWDGVFRETGSSPTPLEASVAASSTFLHTVLWSLPYMAAGSRAWKCFSVPASCLLAEPSTLLGMEEISNKYL